MKRLLLVASGVWIGLSILACLFYPITMGDACARYAPMADAFAAGDFFMAYHPRFGVLTQTVSGLFSWGFGIRGMYAVQITELMFLVSSAVVMFMLARALGCDEAAAWWTFALVLLVPDFLRYAIEGMRDVVKCLAFALLGYGAVAKRPWALAVGLFVYTTSFSYGFAVSVVILIVWCVFCAFEGSWRKNIWLPVLGWSSGTLVVCMLVWSYTGWFLPVPHFIRFLEAL